MRKKGERELEIGQRVMVTIRDKSLSDYYRFTEMPGTILRFRNGGVRVELDDTGSQDSEGHNSYHDFDPADVRPLEYGDKAVSIVTAKDNVEDIGKNKPHFVALALCLMQLEDKSLCLNRWVAIVPPRTNLLQLECPNCKGMDSFASFQPREFSE